MNADGPEVDTSNALARSALEPLDSSPHDAGRSDAPLVEQGRTRTLTMEQAHVGWTCQTYHDKEGNAEDVLISPAGHWYRLARKGEVPDVLAPVKTPGIRPQGLVCIDHWRPT